MDIGTSVGVFLTIAIILLVLFCLVTKYFQYRVNKMAEKQGEEFSQVDEITQNSDDDIQGQYQQFLDKRKEKKFNKKKNRQQPYLFEKTEVEQPINNVSMLKRRLEGEAVKPQELTGRSIPSVRSFRPQRLQTGRSNLQSNMPSDRGLLQSSNNKKPEQPLTRHQFISKLISYSQEGIHILDAGVVSLTKVEGKVREKKMMNTTIISPKQLQFDDQLQALGFESREYSCMKFKKVAEIPFMQQNQQYPISSLKTSQSKEEIDFSQYYMLRDRMENSQK